MVTTGDNFMKYNIKEQLIQLVIANQKKSFDTDVLYPLFKKITELMQDIVNSPRHEHSKNYLSDNLELVLNSDVDNNGFATQLTRNLGSEAKSSIGESLFISYSQLRCIFVQDKNFYDKYKLFESLLDKTDQAKQSYLSLAKEILINHSNQILETLSNEKQHPYLTNSYYLKIRALLKSKPRRLKSYVNNKTKSNNDQVETIKIEQKKTLVPAKDENNIDGKASTLSLKA
jgi:hypothetical protein